MNSSWALLTLTVILLVQQAIAQTDCSKPTRRCKKQKGVCISKTDPCFGDARTGRKWCKNGKKCKCCIGEDRACGDGAEQPACKVLGGYCMNQNDTCNGREVFSQYFCSGSSCKCCIPQEVCPSCEEKAGTNCGGDIFGMTYGGVCKDSCEEGEIRFGDCGPNCGCCVTIDEPGDSCDKELEKVCSGKPFGIPYSGICRATCLDGEIHMAPCGIFDGDEILGRSENVIKYKRDAIAQDDNCGCCIKLDLGK